MVDLNRFSVGQLDYIPKHNENAATTEAALTRQDASIESLKGALSAQGQIDFRLNLINQVDNGSFECTARNPSFVQVGPLSGTDAGTKTFVVDRWYASGTPMVSFAITPSGSTPGGLDLAGTGTLHQDVRQEFFEAIDPLTNMNEIMISADLKAPSGSLRIGLFDGFNEIFSVETVANNQFNRVTLKTVLGNINPSSMRVLIQISGTTGSVRRCMMAWGLLDVLPYSPLPAAQEIERCRRYYESGTWSGAGVGFSGTSDRSLLDQVYYDAQKASVPSGSISFTGTLPPAGSLALEGIDLDGFRVRLSDGDGSTGTGGMAVNGAQWTMDTGS